MYKPYKLIFKTESGKKTSSKSKDYQNVTESIGGLLYTDEKTKGAVIALQLS